MEQIVRYKNGNSLSYDECGDKNGYPILIQHGLIASIHDRDLFDPLLQIGKRLISIARPGYGESSPYVMNNIAEWADIVGVLIDELQLSHFDILGMSSGAPFSYSIGRKFPDKVRNIYIFSGTPALYDETVRSYWPYPVIKDASIAEMEKLARELFFSNLSPQDLKRNDIKDSMMNNCFGVAQDLRLRFVEWGFTMTNIKEAVFMQHCKFDADVPFITAELTSKLLPNCKFDIRESGGHFSKEALQDFIKTVMTGN